MITLRIKKKYVSGYLKGYVEEKDIEIADTSLAMFVDMAKSGAEQGEPDKTYVVTSMHKVTLEKLA